MTRRRRNLANSKPRSATLSEMRKQGINIIWALIGVPTVVIILAGLPKVDFSVTMMLGAGALALGLLGMIRLVEWFHANMYEDDPRKDKPVESTLLPPPPLEDPIDPEATYTLTSDGELVEVVDDETPPPALTFKVNDEDELSNS